MKTPIFSLSTLACLASLGLLSATLPAAASKDPAPYGATPSLGQQKWHDMEMYAFVHFTTNTFTDKEWGFGDESPEIFHPTQFDANQIVGTLAKTGFKGVILTCKHHDGFCLWPTKTTKHSVASSSWKNGQGDVVKEFAAACKKYGVAFGVYVSPWDRNHPDYGTPAYLEAYKKQLQELLTQYGPIFMTWHDGANGGDGYYGGKNEKRSIDRETYYDWKNTWASLKKWQPQLVIFSDIGPDVRWVGNEHGSAGYPCWSTYTPTPLPGKKEASPGVVQYQLGEHGTADGAYWIPAEVDVSIRPGWFWHERENNQVKSPERLLRLYFESVGRGANLNLNVPPDRRGMIHEKDVAALQGFQQLLSQLYAKNYAEGGILKADSELDKQRSAQKALDNNKKSYWMADKKEASLTLTLPKKASFDVLRLEEPIALGQRIRSFSVEYQDKKGEFKPWVQGSSVGARVLLKGDKITTQKLRFLFPQNAALPGISEIALLRYPQVLEAPKSSFSDKGEIILEAPEGSKIYYTTDGSEPTSKSALYKAPLLLEQGGTLRAFCQLGDARSPQNSLLVSRPTQKWRLIEEHPQAVGNTHLFDQNPKTLWHTHGQEGEVAPPQSVVLDLGESVPVHQVLYTPRQDGNTKGIVDQYEVYLSNTSPTEWGQAVSQGEFSNIKSNPLTQVIELKQAQKARYLKFVAKRVVEGNHVTIADLGVVSTPEKKTK